MSQVSEARFLVSYESVVYKCEFNESVCNSKQKWNDDE